MILALLSALLTGQTVSEPALQAFQQGCLASAGDASRLARYAEKAGWTSQEPALLTPMFEDADAVSAFTSDGMTIRLESFEAEREWVEVPASGEQLDRVLRGQRRRTPIAEVLREAPASAICMVDFDQRTVDLDQQITEIQVAENSLGSYPSEGERHTRRWTVDRENVVAVQHVRDDLGRDVPGTASSLAVTFLLPQTPAPSAQQ
ncbi:hypothetical protein [uncultured Brevundimonas sp.]|uniref:hypothetical protein n=1 Tax=uncultured Brevundimonas sp. TaxID=213418 RepID=UPI002614E491|nr:hypothetical protein [uncultured Brevundimonas sp.]